MMQFRDLQRQYEVLKPSLDVALQNVMSRAAFVMGPEVAALESRLANRVNVAHCVTCASGTDALRIALMIWEIGEGDAVFVPDFTFFATAEAVLSVGATPILVDVEQETFNINADDLREKVKNVQSQGRLNPRAVIAVDLFGLPADYYRIREVTSDYGLFLLEDGAQGFGGAIDGKPSCSFGDISITSFFPAKPLGCYGDGGALFTDNEVWADLARSIIQHGKGTNKYEHLRVGLNSRLDTIQAAVLGVKLDAFDEELHTSNLVAATYSKQLSSYIAIPVLPHGYASSWAQYTVKLNNQLQRDNLKEHLQSAGIPSMVYYPCPLHQQPALASLEMDECCCPVATMLSQTVLSLPIHPYLRPDEIEQIISAIHGFVKC